MRSLSNSPKNCCLFIIPIEFSKLSWLPSRNDWMALVSEVSDWLCVADGVELGFCYDACGLLGCVLSCFEEFGHSIFWSFCSNLVSIAAVCGHLVRACSSSSAPPKKSSPWRLVRMKLDLLSYALSFTTNTSSFTATSHFPLSSAYLPALWGNPETPDTKLRISNDKTNGGRTTSIKINSSATNSLSATLDSLLWLLNSGFPCPWALSRPCTGLMQVVPLY